MYRVSTVGLAFCLNNMDLPKRGEGFWGIPAHIFTMQLVQINYFRLGSSFRVFTESRKYSFSVEFPKCLL